MQKHHLREFANISYDQIMAHNLYYKLSVFWLAIAAFIFTSTSTVWADEQGELTAELLAIGMTHDEVKATVHAHPLEQRTSVIGLGPLGKRNTVLSEAIDISPSHQIVVMTHLSDTEIGDGYLLRSGETLLIFENNVLTSKELSGYRWETIEPLALDGMLGMVASEWSGGTHCCYTYNIVALNSTPRIIQKLNTQDSPGKLTPCKERTCLHLTDYTFAYWYSPFANSIDADVVLSLHENAFHFDPDLMRKPYADVTETTVNKIRQAFQKATQNKDFNEAYHILGKELLLLIYGGQANKAEGLVRRVWPQNQEPTHKQAFVTEFMDRLKSSPYWNDLVLLNGGEILGVK